MDPALSSRRIHAAPRLRCQRSSAFRGLRLDGKLAILDPGDRYTRCTGFGPSSRCSGDDLSKSARLGSAGSEAVYFEVRRGTKTQDARLWLGL